LAVAIPFITQNYIGIQNSSFPCNYENMKIILKLKKKDFS